MTDKHTVELFNLVNGRNDTVHVSIDRIPFSSCSPWYYDKASGEIRNLGGSFFRVKGLQVVSGERVTVEQPIILQDEIGYLGIIRKRINGEFHYLMQAKIEPGNVNKIQISPTIQATKSNFTQKHGGKKPAYLDYFINAGQYKIIVDQIQSEQSSRFLGKRNRNIVIDVGDEDVEVLPSHMWMTMPQIKELMRVDNLVNMDTRTVLSCLLLESPEYLEQVTDEALKRSIVGQQADNLTEIYHYINNFKMFDETERRLVPLTSLKSWEMLDNEIVCREPYSFKVIFCDIEIDGREVKHWCQPLFEAAGTATFGLLTRVNQGVREFLVRATPEIGCFDKIELGPSVQREYIHDETGYTAVDKLFDARLKTGEGVKFDTLLSEEGGRFYHEQNRNVIVEINADELPKPPAGYFWTDYKTLGTLVKINNCLNIQLRNLLSVLEW